MKGYVQYGCGFTAPAEWVNYDASPTLRFERLPVLGKLYTRNKQRFPDNVKYGDIVKGLPEKADSCDQWRSQSTFTDNRPQWCTDQEQYNT